MSLERTLLGRVQELAETHRASLRKRPAGPGAGVDEVLARLTVPLADAGIDPTTAVEDLAAGAGPGLSANGPRWFAFVDGGCLPVALAADWLTSAWDQNAGLAVVSPAAAAAEAVVAGWLRDLLGLPDEASFGFVTGGQMANFTALAAARGGLLERMRWDVAADGLWAAPRVSVLVGGASHVTIFSALRMLGMGSSCVRLVATDDHGRTRPDEVRRLLAQCEGPALVCAVAGNLQTGAFDPFHEIADACEEHGNCWLHVDGAFGLWAAAAPSRRHLVAGVDRAASWSVDGHKWLNVPYDSGIAIVRDAGAHRTSMALRAPYLTTDATAAHHDPTDHTPEASRRARGFVLYATLRALGREGVAELVERSCRHARLFAALLAPEPGVQVLNEVVLNQVLVQFPAGSPEATDARTAAVIARVQHEGTCWVSPTTWGGRSAMRISVVNWATTQEDVEISAAAILAAARLEASTAASRTW